jgi:hypothetical protein
MVFSLAFLLLIHAAVACHRLLREFHAARLHLCMGSAAVVHGQHQRRHRALGDQGLQGLGRCRVVHRRTGQEQAELEGRLIGQLDRQPAVVTIACVRVDTKTELVDVEGECFILVAHVEPDDFNTKAHGHFLS